MLWTWSRSSKEYPVVLDYKKSKVISEIKRKLRDELDLLLGGTKVVETAVGDFGLIPIGMKFQLSLLTK